MTEIRKKMQEDKIISELIENIRPSLCDWYNACGCLNQLMGFISLDLEQEGMMLLYWESLLFLHQARINLDNSRKFHDEKQLKEALSTFERTKEHHEKLARIVASFLHDTGEANDN